MNPALSITGTDPMEQARQNLQDLEDQLGLKVEGLKNQLKQAQASHKQVKKALEEMAVKS